MHAAQLGARCSTCPSFSPCAAPRPPYEPPPPPRPTPLQPYSQSARELRRMVLESLDALFGFGIPLPAEAVAVHLEAMEGVFAS